MLVLLPLKEPLARILRANVWFGALEVRTLRERVDLCCFERTTFTSAG